MGKISGRLAKEVRQNRKSGKRSGRGLKGAKFTLPGDVRTIDWLVEVEGYDLLHATYVAAQNLTSYFAEEMSSLDIFDEYREIINSAEDEYLPSGPPMSPLTMSYFTTWAFYDVRFGPDQETMGSCLIGLGDMLGMDALMLETFRNFQNSRMGIFEHLGWDGSRVCLRELVTGEEFK